MRPTCLITGGAGFIGCAISSTFGRNFERVVAIDNMHPQVHSSAERPANLDSRVELVVADVTLRSTWDTLLPEIKPETVVHLAAETGTGQSLTESTRHASVNVVGTTQMLDAFVRHERIPHRIVLTSSRAVYGEGAWRDSAENIFYPGQRSRAQLEAGTWDFPGLEFLPFEASCTEPRPTSVYGATKLAQEMIVSAWGLAFGVEIGILRLQNVYGPGQSLSNPYTGIVALFAQLAKAKQTIPLYEDGEILRDFVFVDDVAKAVYQMATAEVSFGTPFDIGSGKATTIRQLAAILASIYDAPSPVVTGAFRNGDVRAATCDITRAHDELGWQPDWSLERGIAALCAWTDGQLALEAPQP